ncbi:MAG TPA: hypothetical protein VH740_13705 [Vicinamibacterales bacterium]|jgi:hypothetical protein
MGIAQWAGVIDTVGGLVQMARRFRQGTAESLANQPGPGGGPIEARLAGVVVAALKEAFDRDSARMELERSQIDAERRRAEEALRAELRRQAADRLLGQLRLIAVMAVGVWALSAALGVWLPGMRDGVPRVLLGAGWVCALAALAYAFAGWQHVSIRSTDTSIDTSANPALLDHASTMYAPWLLVGALALTGAGLLAAL